MPRSNLAVVALSGPSRAKGDAHALAALAALGQPTRLAIFRLLMRKEPTGLAAGVLAEKIGCPANTLSSHLAILARAGLVRGARDGRAIIYRVDVEGMRGLLGFLIDDCCGGNPALCGLNLLIFSELGERQWRGEADPRPVPGPEATRTG